MSAASPATTDAVITAVTAPATTATTGPVVFPQDITASSTTVNTKRTSAITANRDTGRHTTTTTTTTTAAPTPTQQPRLKDCTTGDMLCPQEWIARELNRIMHKIEPRHCSDYDSLLQVIEDTSRYLSGPMEDSGSSEPGASYHVKDEKRLVRALAHIVEYSQLPYDETKPSTFSSPHRLTQTMDDLFAQRESDGGTIQDTISAQQRLFAILFGKVQLTTDLYHTWKIICDWAKQLLHTHDPNWHTWMAFGLDAYSKAQILNHNHNHNHNIPLPLQNPHNHHQPHPLLVNSSSSSTSL
ncbi:hypothetical protein BCR43DRAFT_488834 [Syncephalastrum racemosum]|uniref:Uncharacterized protein n=1 Tax=Syncephalastrum racemosum TaxID=13706 RepID=A0A1X2HJA8_SYNRA|nr:hypothetical protein BCR43DRAFT_488834 [Syncephalastrum racemosum]